MPHPRRPPKTVRSSYVDRTSTRASTLLPSTRAAICARRQGQSPRTCTPCTRLLPRCLARPSRWTRFVCCEIEYNHLLNTKWHQQCSSCHIRKPPTPNSNLTTIGLVSFRHPDHVFQTARAGPCQARGCKQRDLSTGNGRSSRPLVRNKVPARGTSVGRYLAATSAASYKGRYDYIPGALPLHRSDEASPFILCLPHTASM